MIFTVYWSRSETIRATRHRSPMKLISNVGDMTLVGLDEVSWTEHYSHGNRDVVAYFKMSFLRRKHFANSFVRCNLVILKHSAQIVVTYVSSNHSCLTDLGECSTGKKHYR